MLKIQDRKLAVSGPLCFLLFSPVTGSMKDICRIWKYSPLSLLQGTPLKASKKVYLKMMGISVLVGKCFQTLVQIKDT